MSDLISRLAVGCLLDISKATLFQRFSIGFRSGDLAGRNVVLAHPVGDQFGTMQ